MDRNGDHDGTSKTSSAVDGEHHLLPSHSEIAALAHQIWLEQGSPAHSEQRDWLEAERRLLAERRLSSPHTQQGLATSSGTVQR
jgi:hypothetical protein